MRPQAHRLGAAAGHGDAPAERVGPRQCGRAAAGTRSCPVARLGATLAALADAIIPRTDTPSATEVGVLGWIDVIAADYYTDADRLALTTGLDAIDAQARAIAGQPFAVVTGDTLTLVMMRRSRDSKK